MAEVQDVPGTNLLKRSLLQDPEQDAGLKKQRTVDGVERDDSGDTAVVLQELDEIGANITEILENAEQEKERITRESAAAVQQRLQDRAQVLEQLPGFWAVALRQSLARDYITDDDDKLLEYLVSVDVAEVESLLHITLRFAEDNPYIESTEITRMVAPYDANTPAQVSPVAWKPGQELSPATDDSGTGTFDSCNFFQRITCLPAFDTVDQILHDIFWDPMKYYNGTADLDTERLLQHANAEHEVEEDDEGDEEQDVEAGEFAVGMEQTLEQDPAALQDEAGSSDEDAGSDGDDGEEELNVEDEEVEEDDDDADEADADGDDGDAL